MKEPIKEEIALVERSVGEINQDLRKSMAVGMTPKASEESVTFRNKGESKLEEEWEKLKKERDELSRMRENLERERLEFDKLKAED
jgi:hypothetical protein